jgi:hypothetical protein
MSLNAVKFIVVKAFEKDIYRDIARVHTSQRGDIAEGSICWVATNGRGKRFVIRGLADGLKGRILLDDLSRNELNVEDNSTHYFSISEVGWFGKIAWACSAADAGARIAAWIAVWSFGASIIGIALSVWSIWPSSK